MAENKGLDGFEMVDLDEVEAREDVLEMYKPTENVIDRVGYPLINPKSGKVAIIPVKYFRYYDPEEDKYHKFIAPTDEELFKTCELKCGEVETRWVTVIIKYNTNKKGMPLKPYSGELLSMRLSAKQVRALQKISNVNRGLDKIDTLIETDNPEYMAMDFTATKNVLWKTGRLIKPVEASDDFDDDDDDTDNEKWSAEEIIEEALSYVDNLYKVVAYKYTDDRLRDLFNMNEDGDDDDFDDDDFDDDDFDDIMDEEDEKPAPKKRAPAKKKEVEEEDFDDDDGEEDEKPAPKKRASAKRTPAKRAPAKKKEVEESEEDDFEDEDFDDLMGDE